jgi:hypothetical protein
MYYVTSKYVQLKRKQLHFLTRYEGVAPKLVLLSLLAECCTATLTSALHSVAEVSYPQPPAGALPASRVLHSYPHLSTVHSVAEVSIPSTQLVLSLLAKCCTAT